MPSITVTRKSIIGFGYTSACEQVWNPSKTEQYLRVCEPTKPTHTGTIKTISERIESDRTLQSYRSGTSYKSAWFVKVDGKWKKVTDRFFGHKTDTLFGSYAVDSVNVEIE